MSRQPYTDPLDAALLGRYLLNGNPNDATANSNNGTLVGGDGYGTGLTQPEALSLTAGSSYVDLPTIGVNNTNQAFSLCCWAKINAIGLTQYCIANNAGGPSDNDEPWIILRVDTDGRARGLISRAQVDSAGVRSKALQAGQWYHICYTHDGSRNTSGMRIYINGVLDNDQIDGASASTAVANDDWVIGGNSGTDKGGSGLFDGLIQDARIYNRELTAREVQSIYKTGLNSQPLVLTENLAYHYKLDEGVGTTATDSAGSSDGAFVGGMTWEGGRVGTYCAGFNGNAYINIPNTSFPSQFTATAWVKFDTVSGVNHAIFTKYDNSPTSDATLLARWDHISSQLVLYVYQNHLNFIGRIATGQTASTGTWYHVAYSYDGGTATTACKIYLDGIQVDNSNFSNGSFSSFNSNGPEPIRLGAYSASGIVNQALLDGQIDDARIYDRVLTDAEIRQLYRATQPPFGVRNLIRGGGQ